jgi:hypothetical protein
MTGARSLARLRRTRTEARPFPPPASRFLVAAVLPLLLVAIPRGALPQRTSTDGTIVGQVVDDRTNWGIPGAEVEFLDESRRVRARTLADEEGHFALHRLPPGSFRLRVRRLGYAETTTPPWWVQSGEVLSVVVRLQPDAILLAPLEVTGLSRPLQVPALDGFYRRMETGVGGVYLSRQEIEARNPARITDLLVDVPGIRLQQAPDRLGQLMVVSFNRTLRGRGGGDCPVQVFVDGILASRGQRGVPLDELASPNALEGMEVYRGLASLPAEFVTPDARCGVVILWTRRSR